MSAYAGKTVIVTGGGSGFGKSAAITFGAAGANVVVCGRRADKVAAAAEAVTAAGGRAVSVQADVTSEADVRQVLQRAAEAFGGVDILINNAAVFEPNDVIDTPLAAWNEQLNVNATGTFLMSRELLKHFRARQGGCIVNITSAVADGGTPGFAAYAASKAALESLTRTIAEEAEGYRVSAFLYNPGPVRTEMHATGQDPDNVAPELLKLLAEALQSGGRNTIVLKG